MWNKIPKVTLMSIKKTWDRFWSCIVAVEPLSSVQLFVTQGL